ncbi:MAG: tyrosine-type recombinase/integrase [Chloroflexota bacterium]
MVRTRASKPTLPEQIPAIKQLPSMQLCDLYQREMIRAARSWLVAGKSHRTIDGYLRAAAQFHAYLVAHEYSTEPDAIVGHQVEEWLLELRNRPNSRTGAALKASTPYGYYKGLQQWFRYLVGKNYIPKEKNPIADVPCPARPQIAIEAYSGHTFRALLDACAGDDYEAIRDLAIVTMMADTGLRRQEIGMLQIDSIVDCSYVSVIGKGGRPRTVVLDDMTQSALELYLRARGKRKDATQYPDLWLGKQGPFRDWGIRHMLQKRAQMAGLGDEHIHPHRFRHSRAIRWLLDGGSETGLKASMGWSSSQMIERYTKAAHEKVAHADHRRLGLMAKWMNED